tara:strand:+ start:337 stop:456 length:120 start_codon:yes stop_codon:yes gene_type:complete
MFTVSMDDSVNRQGLKGINWIFMAQFGRACEGEDIFFLM